MIPADVALCVPSTKVAPHLCGDGPAEQTYDYRYINATLTEVLNQCPVNLYQYTFCFDDEQILDGQTLLGSDITGVVCKDCLTKWVEDKVGEEVSVIDNGDGTGSLVSQHGCTYPIVISATGACVEDSDSVDLTVTEDGCISADVNVSEDVGNIIELHADGLFAEGGGGFEVEATREGDGTITLTLEDGDFNYIPGIGDLGSEDNVAATGNNFATALQLNTYLSNITDTSGGNALKLKDSAVNVSSFINNFTESPIAIFPPTLLGNINEFGAGTDYTLQGGAAAIFFKLGVNRWIGVTLPQ